MTNPATLQSSQQLHPIICIRTGIPVAKLTVLKVAGHVPYLSQWRETQALHPLFSLQPNALLSFGRNAWADICSLTPEEAASEQLVAKKEQLLRVASLAMLHHLSAVDQTTVWLPTLAEISRNWSSLLQLSSWKINLDSLRFKFPAVRISKFNSGIDLSGYVFDCWQLKKEYETKVRDAQELELLRTAERTLAVLRDEIAGKAPRSKRMLWRWFCLNVPSRYERDIAGWMWELFDAETEEEISEFTVADINLFEEIFLCEIPLGSTISHTFLERIANKRRLLEAKFSAFEILVPESIALEVAAGSISSEEPKASDFASKTKFIIARAKWMLAHSSTTHRDAALARQETITVKASHTPSISAYLGTTDDEEDFEELGLPVGSNDTITGELEE